MAKFVRTEEMEQKMVMDSFGSNVVMDLEVEIIWDWNKGKLKAYARSLDCFLQFPRALRLRGKKFICDARESTNNGTTFYSAYKGTIRDMEGNVVG